MYDIVINVSVFGVLFFFSQKTSYEMRISDWSSDVCSSDLTNHICSVDARISTCDISIPQRFLQHPNQRQEMLVDRIIIFKAVAERHLDPLFKRRASWIRGAILSLPHRENLLQAEIDPNMISRAVGVIVLVGDGIFADFRWEERRVGK